MADPNAQRSDSHASSDTVVHHHIRIGTPFAQKAARRNRLDDVSDLALRADNGDFTA